MPAAAMLLLAPVSVARAADPEIEELRQVQSGSSGDVFRTQVGVARSLF